MRLLALWPEGVEGAEDATGRGVGEWRLRAVRLGRGRWEIVRALRKVKPVGVHLADGFFVGLGVGLE